MKLNEFFNTVQCELEYLADGSYSFEEYLRLSMNDRRVRNGFVFYALSNKEFANRFFLLSEKKLYVKRLRSDLYKSLWKASRNDFNRPEVKKLAKRLQYLYFNRESNKVEHTDNYDVSAEMEKFFVSLVNHYYQKSEDNHEKEKYRKNVLSNVNWDNLLVNT
ncbi:hypothetical protein AWH56_008920 [Anaerobacillus isosaccharinicus]|uniref:Uncharacterized protein n=1 Tax=Anaerobacillus isosaccharinicus TaxID=1532552 RepID=A0A1S2KYA3_9BACI|nr:hypothetical protein [Anaerobacillus isosaccharinicus]QOY37683.1 hypothetical protein AWH56_008920 [Anaerobacillus isosaccharinicus]